MGEPLVCHRRAVSSMVVARADDGPELLITGSLDETIKVWNPLHAENTRPALAKYTKLVGSASGGAVCG